MERWSPSNSRHNILDRTAYLLSPPDLLFILYADASGVGLGCGLFQIQDGLLRVIGFGCVTLTGSEEKYHNSKLVFLALKWAIFHHFKYYLFYSPHYEVYTDCNPLNIP